MEQLTELISNSSWSEALTLSTSLGISPSYVSQLHFLSLPSISITASLAEQLLTQIDDKLWVAAASFQLAKTSTGLDTVKKAVEKGLEATELYVESQENLKELVTSGGDSKVALERLCNEDEQVKKLCLLRTSLLQLDDRVKTWEEVWGSRASNESASPKVDDVNRSNNEDEEGQGWDNEFELLPTSPILNSNSSEETASLSSFLNSPILETVLALAASADLESLLTVCLRHNKATWNSRVEILATIPEWSEPSRYLALLPGVDEKGEERLWESQAWRKKLDWVEYLELELVEQGEVIPLRSSSELTSYYQERINHLSSLGLISVALSLVQHGASLGVTGLDELGEELSLLSKLVYDRPSTPSTSQLTSEDLTLEYWHSLSPSQIVQSYLTYSTTFSIASDIRRLVLPYLFVIESRLERAGTPNSSFSTQLLIEYILNLVSQKRIDLLVPIFHASNPTLPASQRLIESDSDLARLALACLYGSKETSSDSLLSFGKIFECLPAFEDDSSSPTPTDSPQNLFDTSITSYTPQDLFQSLQSFSTSSLSLSLDALDLHLATSEIFDRYSVPVPLSWFLASHNDLKAQLNWATRMARTSSTGGIEQGTAFESEDEWEGLLEDMVAMTEEVEEGEEVVEVEGMRKPFWLVGREEVTKIFFAGLLASGNFSLAKRLLHPSGIAPPLSPQVEEELIISASHEFYDNAESGNLHKGEMKLAFDCLATAPQSATIKKERDFIEATSRLCSFKIYSQPGIPITPIQIRFAKDRLDFVARLLASNEDAYRHPDVVMELVRKLGYEGDKGAEIRVLAMIADSGLQAGDYIRAADVCDKMVSVVEVLRKDQSKGIGSEKMVEEGAEVAWRNCFQLGKHEDFDDLDRRMKLLGQALILCPGNKISTLLPFWTTLEALKLNDGLPLEEEHHSPISSSSTLPTVILSPTIQAPKAPSRTFTRAAAFLPFAIGPPRVISPQPPTQPPAQREPIPQPPASIPVPVISPRRPLPTPPTPPPAPIPAPVKVRTRLGSPSTAPLRTQSPKMKVPLVSKTTRIVRSTSPIVGTGGGVSPPPPPNKDIKNLFSSSTFSSSGVDRTRSPPRSISPSISPTLFGVNSGGSTQFSNRRKGSGSSATSSNGNTNNNGGFSGGFSNSNFSSSSQQQQQQLSQSQRSYSSHPHQQQQQQQSLNQSTNSFNPNVKVSSPEITRDMWETPDEGLFGVVGGGISSGLTWLIGANEEAQN